LEGVGHEKDFEFAPWKSAESKFLPRLWEQNSKYTFGRRNPSLLKADDGERSVGRKAGTDAYHGADGRINDNGKGLGARILKLRSLAKLDRPVDAFISIHSNATGKKPSQSKRRGTLTLYLDVSNHGQTGNANRAGERLAKLLLAAISAHGGTKRGRALSMRQLGKGIAVLRDTYPHFYKVPTINGANKTARFQRSVKSPGEAKKRNLMAGHVSNKSAGWYFNPFPQKIPTALVEVAYHDNVNDLALLQHRWFQRRIAEGIVKGLIQFFKKKESANR
jgi:N-acetylmuramoyl-L-alanine amidase